MDDFKPINDKFGHAAGDEALKFVAKSLKETIRDQDLAVRFGGDEFAVIFSNTINTEKVQSRMENILQKLRVGIQFEGNAISIEASIGISKVCNDCWEMDCLLERADQALYKAKENGKGVIEVAA